VAQMRSAATSCSNYTSLTYFLKPAVGLSHTGG